MKNILAILIFLFVLSELFSEPFKLFTGIQFNFNELFIIPLYATSFLYILRSFSLGRSHKVGLYVIVFIAVLVVSAAINNSASLLQSLSGIYYLTKIPIIMYGLFLIGLSPKDLRRLSYLVQSILLLNVCIQLIQLTFPSFSSMILLEQTSDQYNRFSGILQANQLGVFLILSYLLSRIKGNKSFHWSHGFFLFGIVLTASNLALLSFLIIVFLDILYVERRKWTIPVITILISAFLSFFGSSLIFRFNQLYELAVIKQSYFRLESYLKTSDILSEHPFFGVGPGYYGGGVAARFGSNYHQVYGTFDYYSRSINIPTTIDVYYPHLLAESGILGLFFFVLIFYHLIYMQHNIKPNMPVVLLTRLIIFLLLLTGISMLVLENSVGVLLSIFAGLQLNYNRYISHG